MSVPRGAGASPPMSADTPALGAVSVFWFLKAGIKLRSFEMIGVKITLSEFPFPSILYPVGPSPVLAGPPMGPGALGAEVVVTWWEFNFS